MKMHHLFASAAALSIASGASAAVVTKSYVTTTTFATGPVTSLTQNFSLIFDPLGTTTGGSVSAYSTSTSYPSFNVPVSFDVTQGGGFHSVNVYGTINGPGVISSTNDFFTQFYVDAAGNPLAIVSSVAYGTAGGPTYSSATSTTTLAATAAVPEPATWAMMIAGFGMAGGAMRRRQRVAIRFA